jgi:putative tryptophan/tyrosine transport system substrate-binding protein
MRRRKFLGGLGGALVMGPIAVRAQQPDRVRRIGVLMASEPDDPQTQARLAGLADGLQKLGWQVGKDVQIDTAWDGGSLERATANAKAFVDSNVDVIVANGTIGIAAARKATQSLPIVFALVGNPVGSGDVESLAHPGGNVTGFSAYEPGIIGKWLGTLKEIAPDTKRMAILLYPEYEFFLDGAAAAGAALGVEITQAMCRDARAIESAIAEIGSKPPAALIVLPVPLFAANRNLIFQAAAAHRVPAIYPFRYYAKAGGLISYGIDTIDIYRRTASYVVRILRGEKPGDLPVQAPTNYNLVINLKTAKVLGLKIPPMLLARADETIE